MRKVWAVGTALLLLVSACDGDDGDDEGERPAGSPTTEAVTERAGDLTLVGLNLLHGAFCPDDTEGCRAAERVELFLRQIDGACPDVVALQEIDARLLELIRERAGDVCAGRYEVVWHGTEGIDRELVLSRVPVTDMEFTTLAGNLRSAFWVRLESELGAVDLVVTHLASSDNPSCDARRCPPPCDEQGDVRTCQAVQVAEFLDAKRVRGGFAVVTGDLNDVSGSPTLDALTSRGLVDSHLAAGNPECDPSTGEGCTSGREDQSLADLTDPESRQAERIDYVLVAVPDDCEAGFDDAGDADGDGVTTGLFNADPFLGGPAELVHPSDHTAVSLDLSCN